MTQHVSFILRLKLTLDLIRKVARGDKYTTRYMCKGSVSQSPSQSLGQKLSDKNQNLSEKKRQIRLKVKRQTYLSGNKL